MKLIDTQEYVSALRELTEEGHEVSMLIVGSSMAPFLGHKRDTIFFIKKDRKLRRGDMVFYQRDNGQYVMHRICKVHDDRYDIVGDAQMQIEHDVREDQVFARITRVRRKGKLIDEKHFWWFFFEHIWINVIPYRHMIWNLYGTMFHRAADNGE